MKYYMHSVDEMDDEKVSELFYAFGYEGTGLYHAICEKLAKAEKPINTILLKRQLGVGKRLERCWLFMEKIGIISSSNEQTFTEKLANNVESFKKKRENNSKRVSQWRNKQEDTESVTHYERVGNTFVTPLNINNNINSNIKETNINDISNNSTLTNLNNLKEKEKEIYKDKEKENLYSEEQQSAFLSFQKYISEKAPRVARMKKPFTISEFLSLKKDYTSEQISEMLLRMENYAKLHDNLSANLTMRKWLKMEQERTDRNVKPLTTVKTLRLPYLQEAK